MQDFKIYLPKFIMNLTFNQGISKNEIYNKSLSIRGGRTVEKYKANIDFMKRADLKITIVSCNTGHLLVFSYQIIS